MMRAIRLGGCVPLLFVGSCCCDDDDCWWTTECYWSGCCYTCYDVEHCDYYYGVAVASGDLDFDATVADAGDGKIDILVSIHGKWADGSRPLSVRLIGPEVADFRRESDRTVWDSTASRCPPPRGSRSASRGPTTGSSTSSSSTTSGNPCRAIPGTASWGRRSSPRSRRVSPSGPTSSSTPPRRGRARLGSLHRPRGRGLPARRTRPAATVLQGGEGSSIRLDRAGRWTFRSTLLADDACGGPSADSTVVEETEIEVR